MKVLVLLGAILFLSGCAGQMTFEKPRVSQQQFYADQSFCDERASVSTQGQRGFSHLANQMMSMQLCMAGKGYTCHYSQSNEPCEISN